MKTIKISISFCLLAVGFLLGSHEATADSCGQANGVCFIKPSGSSGNGNSWASAWVGFGNLSSMVPGTTICVAGGNYHGQVDVSVGGTQNAPILIKRATVNDPVCGSAGDGWSNSYDSQVIIGEVGGAALNIWNHVNDLTWDGVTPSGILLNIADSTGYSGQINGIRTHGAHDSLTFKNIEIAGPDTPSSCVDFDVDAVQMNPYDDSSAYLPISNTLFNHVIIHDVNVAFGMSHAPNTTIEYSKIYGTKACPGATESHHDDVILTDLQPSLNDASNYCVFRFNDVSHWSTIGFLWGNWSTNAATYATGWKIYGNVFHDGATRVFADETPSGASPELVSNLEIYNNTFANLINVFGDDNRFTGTAENNLFFNTEVDWPSVSHDYNLFNNVSPGTGGEAHESDVSGQTFVSNTDYHLIVNTAAGINLGSPYNVDKDGVSRTSWSRGAYEYAGSPMTCGQVNGTCYVDSQASGAVHDGSSWATAWTSIYSSSNVPAGTIVYISGGPSGQTRTYMVSNWVPKGGSSGHPVTYQIGQDSAHNGTAVFDCGGGTWMGDSNGFSIINYITISGDAGDGNMHFKIQNVGGYESGGGVVCMGFSSAGAGLKFLYINFDNFVAGMNIDYPQGVEVGYCRFNKSTSACDYLFTTANSGGSTYGINSFHHCVLYLPRISSAYPLGDDGLAIGGYGWDIYNNTFYGKPDPNWTTSWINGQHQDGMQFMWGGYLRIYNNTFYNLGDSCIYLDNYYGGISHARVYNNVMSITDRNFYYQPGNVPASSANGIECVIIGTIPLTVSDLIIANNTAVDIPGVPIYMYVASGGSGGNFSNCIAKNNIAVNCPSMSIDGTISQDNTNVTTANGVSFVSYVPWSVNNNFHLTATDTLLRGMGDNLASIFNTDKDGNSRPPSGAWDIGAYEYVSGNPSPTPTTSPTPSVTPSATPTVSPTPTPTVNPTPTPNTQTEGFLPFKNVFNPEKESVNISYTFPAGFTGDSTLVVYDRQGMKVKELNPAANSATWDGKNSDGQIVAAGTYIVILKKGDKTFKKKVVAIK